MRRVAFLAAALAAVIAGGHAFARSLDRRTMVVDLRTSSVTSLAATATATATATAPPTAPPAAAPSRPTNLRCRDLAAASFAVHGGVLDVTDAGSTRRVRFASLDDSRNWLTWSYARGGVAVAAVRTFHPGARTDDGHDELVAVDLATGGTLWSRSLPDWAPDCFLAGSSIAMSHGHGLEFLDPRTGATTHAAVAVTGWPASMLPVAGDRLLYCTSLEMAMLDAATLGVLWRAPLERDQGVAFTANAVLTTAVARSATAAAADVTLVTRDLRSGALVRTTPLTRYASFFDVASSRLASIDADRVEVQLEFVVLD